MRVIVNKVDKITSFLWLTILFPMNAPCVGVGCHPTVSLLSQNHRAENHRDFSVPTLRSMAKKCLPYTSLGVAWWKQKDSME